MRTLDAGLLLFDHALSVVCLYTPTYSILHHACMPAQWNYIKQAARLVRAPHTKDTGLLSWSFFAFLGGILLKPLKAYGVRISTECMLHSSYMHCQSRLKPLKAWQALLAFYRSPLHDHQIAVRHSNACVSVSQAAFMMRLQLNIMYAAHVCVL